MITVRPLRSRFDIDDLDSLAAGDGDCNTGVLTDNLRYNALKIECSTRIRSRAEKPVWSAKDAALPLTTKVSAQSPVGNGRPTANRIMKCPNLFWKVALLFGLVLSASQMSAPARVSAQDIPAPERPFREQAQALLNAMDPSQRVGQLFLVTFEGSDVTAPSAISELIASYHVGGVMLLAENGNFQSLGDGPNDAARISALTAELQRLALEGLPVTELEVGDESDAVPPTPDPRPPPIPVPLLLATIHDGDALPLTNTIPGFTDLPGNMAIGATWDPEYARQIGQIAGEELTGAGFNLLLGPSLDVLERPSARNRGDLGTNSFGGDPYWTGLMGQAYVEGMREGSSNRLAVTAKSFPGMGSSDRPITEEVPTVRRSLEQLKQIELAPFFAVTQGPLGEASTVDALLATHIRYQGFQGNIRATTAPVSLDPQALNTLMALPEFAPWRSGGGLIISDALGVQSVERFYDDTEQEFPHRQVAKDALLAGNDLLYVGDFALGSGNFDAELANVKDTILWFEEKYLTDPTFQLRVDEALLRILELKLRLYEGDFESASVVEGAGELETNGELAGASVDLSAVSEAAVTLLSPTLDELSSRIVTAPGINDKIVIFTDAREIRTCPDCPASPVLDPDVLAERMLALYGPQGSAQIQPDNVTSFTFADLDAFLLAGPGPIALPTPPISPTLTADEQLAADLTAEAAPEDAETIEASPTPDVTPTPPADYRVQEALRDADWLVFGLLDAGANSTDQNAFALNRFLAQRADLASNRQVVVMAYDAPYFLDSTEISKLTAYYGIYSRTQAFIDSSIRALFLESPLSGAPPVDVEGIRYELFKQTQPNPAQIIELFFLIEGQSQSPSGQQPTVAQIGETLNLQTGVVEDHNGNQVPDGTLVRFMLRDRVQGTVTILGDRPTRDGVARLAYVLDASMGPGQFRITAESGEALLSQEVDIVIEDDAQVAIIVPTPLPTATIEPTPTTAATPEPTETATSVPPTATPQPPQPVTSDGLLIDVTSMRGLMMLFGGLLATVALGAVVNSAETRLPEDRVGRLLWGVVGALAAYIYTLLGLPGSSLAMELGNLSGLATTIGGGIIGLILFQIVHRES